MTYTKKYKRTKRSSKSYHEKRSRYRRRSSALDVAAFLPAIVIGAILIVLSGSVDVNTAALVPFVKNLLIYVGIFLVVVYIVGTSLRIRKVRKERREWEHTMMSQRTLEQLRAMDPFDFEHYIGWLFAQYGYESEVTQARNDGGIDVILTMGNERYGVQVKQYNKKGYKNANYVTVKEVRELFGVIMSDQYHAGMFVTTSYFSKDAIEFCKNKKNMYLYNADDLVKLVANHQKHDAKKK